MRCASPQNGAIGASDPATVTILPAGEDASDYKTVTIGAVENGTITPSTTLAKAGDTVTLTVTPKTGYELTVEVAYTDETGAQQTLTPNAGGEFTMPDADVTITTITLF